MLSIHPNARTTPAVRAEIARSTERSGVLAERHGVSTAGALATALDRDLQVAATALDTLATVHPPRTEAELAALYARAASVGAAVNGWVALLAPDLKQIFNTLRPLGAELPTGNGGPFVQRALQSGGTGNTELSRNATTASARSACGPAACRIVQA